MKPVIVFLHKKQLWLKIGICIVSTMFVIFGCYSVYSVVYSTWLLYRCKHYGLNITQKKITHTTSDTNSNIKKSVSDYLSLKKKYENRLRNAHTCFNWANIIIAAIHDAAILEQLTVTKTEISCSITAPDLQRIFTITELFAQHGDFKQATVQSYQKTSDDKIHASLSILPQKGR